MTHKTKKLFIVAASLITAVVLVIAIILFFTLKDFKTIASGEIIKDIYAIKGNNVNMYLVKLQNGDYIGFDAAVNAKDVQQELAKLKIDPERVVAVFLTHTDYDHVGALKIFNKARIYISEQEEQMINGKTKRFFFSFNDRLPAPYLKLNDKDVINFGNTEVTAVAAYGHTPGSFSYIVNNNILFSGDNLLLVDNKVTTFPRLFTMDRETQKGSIRKLARFTDLKYDFTAHSSFTDNFQEAVKEWK